MKRGKASESWFFSSMVKKTFLFSGKKNVRWQKSNTWKGWLHCNQGPASFRGTWLGRFCRKHERSERCHLPAGDPEVRMFFFKIYQLPLFSWVIASTSLLPPTNLEQPSKHLEQPLSHLEQPSHLLEQPINQHPLSKRFLKNYTGNVNTQGQQWNQYIITTIIKIPNVTMMTAEPVLWREVRSSEMELENSADDISRNSNTIIITIFIVITIIIIWVIVIIINVLTIVNNTITQLL